MLHERHNHPDIQFVSANLLEKIQTNWFVVLFGSKTPAFFEVKAMRRFHLVE
jgi:hypothetical protein